MKLKFVFLSAISLSLCCQLALAQVQNDSSAAPSQVTDTAAQSAPESAEPEETVQEAKASDAIHAESAIESTPAVLQVSDSAIVETQLPEAGPVETKLEEGVVAEASDSTTVSDGGGGATASDNRGPLTLDHELPAAIQFLARMANINIHFDPSVTFTNIIGADGKPSAPVVSLRWDNVTAEDALQEVLDVHGLTLINNPRTGIARVTRKPTLAPLITSIVQLRYTNPTNMVELIRTTFTEPNRSKVSADIRTSQLVIVTTERDMDAITNLLTRLDIPSKQVLIEARLLETSKNPRSVKGVDWSGTLEGQKFTFGNGITAGTATTREGAATTTTLPSGRSITGSSRESTKTDLTTLIGSGGISLDTMRGFHPATAFLNADGVSAVLSFLNSDNDTEVIATPRAVTLDNQTARLEVTRAFPIFQITPGSANSPAGAQVLYTNVGTILKVTPRISANSNIALKVIPEVSNIDSKDVQIVNGTRNEANVYAVRRMEADVVIPSGNTLVMGGLISDTSSKSHTKVPLLGDLPGVGLAFRKDGKSRSKANLLIFVTPTIVRDEDFQPTTTDFLQSKAKVRPETEVSPWDSGKPKQWFKKKSNE
ncbi:MAG: hypothetical protein L0Z50_18285 [Verrucomicrobiales bacterium]|nr:hypothetical protein [Verrucomicrobiales bacterium]